MLRCSDYKAKTAHKLVADPFAEERHWLPACEARYSDITPSASHRVGLRSSGPFLFALFLSVVIAIVYAIIVYVGYDWGYGLVENVWGQPDEILPWIWAVASLGVVILPGAFGLAFGAFRSHLNGGGKAWFWAPFVLSASITFGLTLLLWLFDSSQNSDLLWVGAIVLASSMVSMATGLRIGSWVYSELKKRVRAPQMFLWSLSALLSFVILNFVPGLASWPAEMAGYFLTIFAGAGVAAYVVRSKDRTAGMLAGFFAMLPILLANFLNLASNVWSWSLDSIEWHSLASAVALNVVAMSAVCAGGAMAAYLRQYKLPHH